MKTTRIYTIIFIICILSSLNFAKDISAKLKDSLVYLQVAYYGYTQYEPWKNMELSEGYAVGCAVDDNKVITLASSVANAAFVQARKSDRNDFIPARILAVDYESNLALIELDPNSIGKELKPLKFDEKYVKGAGVNFYWLSAKGQMFIGRGFLDRVTVANVTGFYSKSLTFVAAGISEATNLGQLYCLGEKPIGIASLSGKETEADIIPAKVINRFLDDVQKGTYNGIAMRGFSVSNLVDPAMRKYLKIPNEIRDGVYVSDIYTIGTGSDVLKKGDVLLGIDGFAINPYGRYDDKKFDTLPFETLITSKTAGETITFEVWRDGKKQNLTGAAKRFDVGEMLVPFYEYDTQPEYVIVGGCILQKLTQSYLAARGDEWRGKVEPHLYSYLLNEAFKPSEERKDIVILSYCLPANINLGYHSLNQCVVDKINGMKIKEMKDVPIALALNPESKFIVIEFEMDKPAIVLDRSQLENAGKMISQTYGIGKLMNINE
ncbi:MAG: hypothetical protein A2Y12_09035 [Planctomycetes bacterium GWF2_42_9]|nr:MAG: hypothetical protein A2Y12_09035 [Planctomycetes bacterium GWF2_42_9]HAL45385.1 hypothetical protein [Phycisphaerales bacterium]